MLLKYVTILAALLFAWNLLALAMPSAAHDTAISLVRAKARQPSQRPDTGSDKKATIRHAILRDADVRNQKGDDMSGKMRDAMKRRLQAQSMT